MDSVVLVTGLPGSGKTSVARPLARALDISLLSEDSIKETFFELQHVRRRAESIAAGHGARRVFLSILDDCRNVVVDAFWRRSDVASLTGSGKYFVQVHCSCGPEEAMVRYRRRATSLRHWGHFDEEISYDENEVWFTEPDRPLPLDGPLISVDTSGPVEIEALARRVQATRGVSCP